MGRPIASIVTLGTASATAIANSQSLAAAGTLTINGSAASGGVATLDAPRRVIITSAGNDSALKFTVVGTARPEQGGAALSEIVNGGSAAAVATQNDFATVTTVSSNGSVASTVEVGTNTTGSGPWVPWDTFPNPFQVQANARVLGGSPTFQVDYTTDDVFSLLAQGTVVFVDGQVIASGSTAAAGSIPPVNGGPPQLARATRLTLTQIGTVELVQIQQGY